MIYFMSSDEKHIVILEPGNLAAFREGKTTVSTDNMVIIAYSPDIEWTLEELKKVFNEGDKLLTPEKLTDILKRGLERPEVMREDRPEPPQNQADMNPPPPGPHLVPSMPDPPQSVAGQEPGTTPRVPAPAPTLIIE